MRLQRPDDEEKTGDDGEENGVGEMSIDSQLGQILFRAKGSSGGQETGEDPIIDQSIDYGQGKTSEENSIVHLVMFRLQTKNGLDTGQGEVQNTHSQHFLLQRSQTRPDESIAQSNDDHQHSRHRSFQTREKLRADQRVEHRRAKGDEYSRERDVLGVYPFRLRVSYSATKADFSIIPRRITPAIQNWIFISSRQ